jgi:Micrococcal nuclease (thermonuclease) homologs
MWFAPLLLAAAAASPSFACEDPFFHDGDNIRCAGQSMRLAGIDAPELAGSPRCRRRQRSAAVWCDHPLGIKARNHLRVLGSRGEIWCRRVAPNDRYGRPIVRCVVNGRDLGEEMVRAELAKRWP